ncbi:MAG TPA: ZIP family metal transporter [Clostridiales bacterium]|nr:ZIP family metal transporter [Clostridiales bacterium]
MRWDLFLIMMIIPWVATFAGSYSALLIKVDNNRRQGALLGFASGVMIAASIWSLIIPAFEEAGITAFGAFLVTLGFALGCIGMLVLNMVVPHEHEEQHITEGPTSHLSRPILLVLAVALHNIPEGMALGVVISSAMQNLGMSWTAAIVFSLGLAIQNFPEGFAVIFPLYQSGVSKKRCTWLGFLASLAEPAAALLGLAAASLLSELSGVMPVLLAVAAGAMIFIVVEELIPESQAVGKNHFATYGFLIGFWIMAVMGILGT